VRETAERFHRDLIAFRRTLHAHVGRSHPEYQKLRVVRVRTTDGDDDEIAEELLEEFGSTPASPDESDAVATEEAEDADGDNANEAPTTPENAAEADTSAAWGHADGGIAVEWPAIRAGSRGILQRWPATRCHHVLDDGVAGELADDPQARASLEQCANATGGPCSPICAGGATTPTTPSTSPRAFSNECSSPTFSPASTVVVHIAARVPGAKR